MPRIFDNIELKLLPILQETLKTAKRADFCVGYFNLRGWQGLDRQVEQFPGGDQGCCRLIVGMQKSPSPHEVFVTLKDKTGQSKKLFFVRAGNSTHSPNDPSEMLNYIKQRS